VEKRLYDLAVVGGGLAGSTLALSLAKHGARVIVVENQPVFRDRIHGEVTHPWESPRLSNWASTNP